MKKIILILVSFVFSASAYAQLDNAWQTTKQTVTEFTTKKEEKACPVYSNTPISKINREAFEIELSMNLAYIPNNGGIQFRTDSFSGELIHNFSNVFGVYARYDGINFDKNDYSDESYREWSSDWSAAGGFHFYFFPTFRLYGGMGTAEMKHDGKKSEYGTFTDWGIKFDFPLESWGYKLVAAYRLVIVDMGDSAKDENPLEDWSYSGLSVGVSIPFGYGK